MKQKMVLTVLILLLFLTSGCWSRLELDKRAIVAGYGADKAKEEGKIDVTVQVVRPGGIRQGQEGGGGGPQQALVIYTGAGSTFFDAIHNLSMVGGRKLFLTETKILVVGDGLAREGIGSVIDFYDRNREASTLNTLLVAKGEAKEVMETEFGTERIWAYGINQAVKAMTEHGKAPDIEIRDFLKAVESKTTAPVAAAVQVVRKEKGEEGAGGNMAAPPKEIKVSGSAVFHHYKLAGWLNEKETRGLLWVTGRIKGGIITAPAPWGEGKRVSFEIVRASGKVKPEIKDGNLTITVEVRAEGDLAEVQPDSVDISSLDVWRQLEDREKEAIEEEIRAVVVKAQELNADIFGFGEAVHRKHPREWKQLEDKWAEIFPALTVNLAVDAKLRRPGKVMNAAR